MKKLIFSLLAFIVFSFPLLAQLTEEVPVTSLTLKKGNIPPAILKAADQLFAGNTQIEWGSFPFELKDYGWYVDKNYDLPIDHYAIRMKKQDGSEVYAVFEDTGELIRFKETDKSGANPPAPILNTIKAGEYKDWKIATVEHIVVKQKKVPEHYLVKLEKDGKKKNLSFSPTGQLLAGK